MRELPRGTMHRSLPEQVRRGAPVWRLRLRDRPEDRARAPAGNAPARGTVEARTARPAHQPAPRSSPPLRTVAPTYATPRGCTASVRGSSGLGHGEQPPPRAGTPSELCRSRHTSRSKMPSPRRPWPRAQGPRCREPHRSSRCRIPRLCRRAIAREVLDGAHKELHARRRVNAVEDGEQSPSRKLVELRRPVRRP